jgi:hypothetical protein
MRTRSALLPLALVAGLAGASPAAAATHHTASRHLKGGDAPPTIPSLVQTRITRTENALERLDRYVDNQNATKVTAVSKVIRRQTSAAWRGAVYYLRTAPPPVIADSLASVRGKRRTLHGGAIGPVVADQFTTAVAVFGLAHDVSAETIMLVDGAHGNTLTALNRTLFWTLDKRDAMVQTAETFEPPPAPDAAGAARTRPRLRPLKGTAVAGGSFAPLMPAVTAGLDDEIQGAAGLLSDATNLGVRGPRILRNAESQILLTEHTINTLWPPVPAEG